MRFAAVSADCVGRDLLDSPSWAVRSGLGLGRQLAAAVGAGDQLVGRGLPFGMKPDFIPK